MKKKVEVRWVSTSDEIKWVNDQYNSIEFVLSDFKKDKVAIAFIDGEKAGLGRLVPLQNGEYEMGGIFALPQFRNKGVARSVVSFLVENAPVNQKIYCLPFEHLTSFYEEFGFNETSSAPQDVLEKLEWCLNSYPHTVLSMVKEPRSS